MFIEGSAGQGKTALASAFAQQAQADYDDLLVAWGHCNAFAGIGDPYLPFRDIMGMLTGDVATRLAAGIITINQAILFNSKKLCILSDDLCAFGVFFYKCRMPSSAEKR